MEILRIAGVGNHLLVEDVVVLFQEFELVHELFGQETGVARIHDLDLAHHLADDHFKVLVVDLHTLHAVDFLDLVDDVFLYLDRAEDVEDVGSTWLFGIGRAQYFEVASMLRVMLASE